MNWQRRFLVFLFLGGISFFFFKCESPENSILGPVAYPKDNLANSDIAKLGKKLFFDKRLSSDNTISCSTCHEPNRAFSDGEKLSVGVHGRTSMRNSPSLFNVAYQKKLMFDGQVPSIEMQILVPLQDSNEMNNQLVNLLSKLKKSQYYKESSLKLFGRDFDIYVLTRSLASYLRTLITKNSPFDRYYYFNEKGAISQEAINGWKIFSKELYCTKCHNAPLFTNLKVENNGLYSDYNSKFDKGRFRITGDSLEIGSFKVPSLRNISLTWPYMHDGSFANLDDVLTFYSLGGNRNANQNSIIRPFKLDQKKRNFLKAFLRSLEEK